MQDFLAAKLGMKGGRPKPVIPFLKRIGFLGTDGAPTELYKRFRNSAQSGSAAAQALRKGFAPLYEINEYVHELNDNDLRGVIVQATGAEAGSGTVRAIVGSFKALKAFANFEDAEEPEAQDEPRHDTPDDSEDEEEGAKDRRTDLRFGLSYTINLNLPATSDIAVFDAIFRSLKANLLK